MSKKDWVSRELTIEIIVGAFVVMIFLGLAYFTIILSHSAFVKKRYYEEVCFRNVMGLGEGDNVVVRGMPVGTVKKLVLDPDSDGVKVLISLDYPIKFRIGYRISIVATSILGGRHMRIEEGKGAPLSKGYVLHGMEPYDLIQTASEIVDVTRDGVVNGKLIENFVEASRQFREIIERVNQGEGLIGTLVAKRSTLYDDISSTASSLKTISERIEKGDGMIGKLVSEDDTLYKDLSAAVKSLRAIGERIEKGEGTIGRLTAKDDPLYSDLTDAVKSLKNIVARVEKGEGLLGQLIVDDKLYSDVEDIVQEARGAIDDYRETAPLVTFASVFFGAF